MNSRTAKPRWLTRYASYLVAHPWRVFVAGTLVTAASVTFAAQLEFRVDLRELLPSSQRSVIDLKRIEERVGGTSTLTVAVEGENFNANKRFVEALVPRIAALGKDRVKRINYSTLAEKAFFDQNKYLYARLEDLVEFRDHLKKEFAKQALKHSGILIDFSDDTNKPASKAVGKSAEPKKRNVRFDEFRAKYREKAARFDRFTDGYYVGENGKLLAIIMHLPESGASLAHVLELSRLVKAEVEALAPAKFDPSIRVGLTSPLITANEEIDAIKEEVTLISLLCLGLVIGSIVLFFRRVRALGALGLSLIYGVAWTFGLTQIVIGYLNTATAFLGSIVAGNGINFGIIFLARYLEERRNGVDVATSLVDSFRFTATSTATAAIAASIAYGSLLVTDFRGFNQFGFIGGVGMLLCWVSAFTILPALLVIAEKVRPVPRATPHPFFEHLFTFGFPALIRKAPRSIALVGTALVVVAGVLVVSHANTDPFDYDLAKLRSQKARQTGSTPLSNRIARIIEGESEAENGAGAGKRRERKPTEGMIVLADRHDQVATIKAALLAKQDKTIVGERPIAAVGTIDDILPKNVEKKIPIIKDIRRRVLEDAWEYLSEDERREVADLIPPADLTPLTAADLPEVLSMPFTERNGVRGLILYVAMSDNMSYWSGHHLIHFAEAVRTTALPTGEIVTASGQHVILADMLNAIRHDGPRAILISLVGVILLVVIVFRRASLSLLVLFALAVGVLGMAAIALATGMRLNFLNFVAIPITLGIGVDYAVNIFMRYRHEGRGSMPRVIALTGGAVMLCSLTTMFGYGSLLISDNAALVSFGVLANIGEVTCIVAAMLILPALVTALEKRKTESPIRLNGPINGNTRSSIFTGRSTPRLTTDSQEKGGADAPK